MPRSYRFVLVIVCVFLLQSNVAEAKKHVLMIAGNPSHGFGAHEHYAGLKILEEAIAGSSENVELKVVKGWPGEEDLAKADSIVLYCDGQKRHTAMDHRDELRKRLADGCGLVCIHYAVEMLPGESGKDWVEMLGGHFEINYSVNPHWVADFKSLPLHPTTNGVKPFATNDEWYFHMRFSDQGKVTPILSAIAPLDTMSRKDGAHSGNPHVRKSVEKGEPQVVAWAYDRPDGGRSFGFTGGHFHWNWANDDQRRLVCNAIRWTAGDEIEADGSSLGKKTLDMDRLYENQDFSPKANFSGKKTAKDFNVPLGSGNDPKPEPARAKNKKKTEARRLFHSNTIRKLTKRQRVEIDTSIKGVKDLYLVVDDGGDGYTCDWADWIDPTIHGAKGTKSLVDLGWVSASSQFGKVQKNKNCRGEDWSVDGAKIGKQAIGTHANSVIHFKIPDGFDRLTVTGALDSGGTSQAAGDQTSVRFAVYADGPPSGNGRAPGANSADAAPTEDQRKPENALAGIEIAEGLQATLCASEPHLKSLTNLDVDDRGRVWVCDVMNYRRNNGKRPEGDRILILEDTTGDGVMDKVKTFYQGRDIDSAMGLCVLGNQVIVTATPTVWRFTDTDGDDLPDKKEALFTETGQPQHDHSAHSFLFGPDGKLYWNFGNTGKQVKDANGETVIDIHGRPVVDNGKPFYGGMPFRCDLDGKNFEVLAHNFRNNWETTVDSFGTLWQSDNDDDGNRGTRINFVMEHGNYGYRDELTGAGWRDQRITMEDEVPLRHWHLNDPGVVPNMLQTGAGSPSGICMYEGRLLPKRFWDQIIHCDPGPNIVRAYPAKPDGAGYSATIEPLMTGTTDKWFRPADVCVAPDGSLFVTDWYDPGVGGHNQRDSDRGRLFRLAPTGTKYTVPKFDYSTAAAAVDALKNPNLSVRYKAWMALNKMGAAAETELLKLYGDSNQRLRARALWLLGKIEGRGEHYVQTALQDDNADIRITGIRLAKHLGMTASKACAATVTDPSVAVRRELAVALRFDKSDSMPALWAQLAESYDGNDRWFLEALGIASDLRAAECYDAWLSRVGDWNTAAGRDIAWRVRAPKAAEAIATTIADPKLSVKDTNRYFRSLEYHDGAVRTAAMQPLLNPGQNSARSDAVLVRAVERMDGDSYKQNENAKQAIQRHIDRVAGTSEYLSLLKKFRPEGVQQKVESVIFGNDNSAAVEAAKMLGDMHDGPTRLRQLLKSPEASTATRVADVLGLLGNGRSNRILGDYASNAEIPYEVRRACVAGLAKTRGGEGALLAIAESKKLVGDTRLLAGALLARAKDANVKKKAATILPQPSLKDRKPLAPLDKLATMKGNVADGMKLFRGVATCANCHVVDQHGKEVGPNLSEIGSKLSREAMLTSILDPSAGISHNFENYVVLTDAAQVITGIKVSETDAEVVIRTAEAIDRKIPKGQIDQIKKSEKSIMPENLHHAFDQQGLIDIVEYMTTLKKK